MCSFDLNYLICLIFILVLTLVLIFLIPQIFRCLYFKFESELKLKKRLKENIYYYSLILNFLKSLVLNK